MHNMYRDGRAAVYGIVLDNNQDAEEQAENPPRRVYRNVDPFDLGDVRFVKMFRLTKDLTRRLIEILTPYLIAPGRTSDVTIQTKVIVSLRFFATGSYQEIIGSNIFSAVSQSTISRAITEVTDALNQPAILNAFVKFPRNREEMINLRTRSYAMLILDDDRLEGMRCSRCRKYLSVFPVKNHPKSRDVTCGRCSRYDDNDGGVPSALYELVAVEYLFRCVNRYEGCGKLLRVDETEAHERRCVGGTFRCTKCKDGAERSALELTWHYKIEHPSSYLREKNRFDARPQTADVKLYVRDDVFAFVLVHYGPNALHLAAATLTEVDVSQEFSVSKGERLWERTERRPCKAIGAYDVDRYVVDMDPPTSVEVTFDLVASKGAGLYDVSVPRPIKKAIADASKGKTFRVQTAEDIEGMFGYKLNDRGMALLNSAGKEIDLNCSNCKHLIGLYIYRCVKANHQLCHDCRAWCGICDDGQVQVPTSCELLRAISRLLKFPCRWKCGAYFTAYLRKHERSCESRIFKCPMCSFAVNWSNLTLIKDHLETDHGISNFLGDYDWWRIKLFLRQKVKGELSFMYNDKCCYLRWARDGNGPYYDLYFGLYRNEPNVQMAFIDVESGRKYLNVIRAAPQDSWSYSPYINFGHKK